MKPAINGPDINSTGSVMTRFFLTCRALFSKKNEGNETIQKYTKHVPLFRPRVMSFIVSRLSRF